jgi:hypothetical protein
LEKALRGCAEGWAPRATDAWPAIRERVSSTAASAPRASGARTGEGGRASGGPRRPLLVPDDPLGWVLAVFSVLILGAGAYAASGPVRELIESGLPGPGSPGPGEATNPEQSDGLASGKGVADRLFRHYLPGGEGAGLGEEIGQTKTADGAKVTLERAYADEDVVVVSYSVQDLRDAREIDGRPFGGLEPFFITKEDEGEPGVPSSPYRGSLTSEGAGHYSIIDGTHMVAGPGATPEELRMPMGHASVFEVPEGLEPGRAHRFRLEIPLYEGGGPMRKDEKPKAGPFIFEFEIPVRPYPTIEVGQKATTKGVTLTLERVLNSPGRPQAVVCFDPPNDDYLWRPSTAPTGFQREEPLPVHELGGGCWSLTLDEPVEGRSSVTVTEIWGPPRTERAMQEDEDGKEIRGPWTFEFEVPAP